MFVMKVNEGLLHATLTIGFRHVRNGRFSDEDVAEVNRMFSLYGFRLTRIRRVNRGSTHFFKVTAPHLISHNVDWYEMLFGISDESNTSGSVNLFPPANDPCMVHVEYDE